MSKAFGFISKLLGQRGEPFSEATARITEQSARRYEITKEVRGILQLVEQNNGRVIFVLEPLARANLS